VEAQRKEAFFQIEPHAFDWIELGAIGRQRHERDVAGNIKRFAAVPAGPVNNKRHVLVLRDRRGEGVEEHLHARRVGVRQDQRKIVVGARLDGGVDVGVGIALIEKAPRTLAALPPDVADATFLPDARFILEIKAQMLIFVRELNVFQNSQGSF
jgi:hypothetical protein